MDPDNPFFVCLTSSNICLFTPSHVHQNDLVDTDSLDTHCLVSIDMVICCPFVWSWSSDAVRQTSSLSVRLLRHQRKAQAFGVMRSAPLACSVHCPLSTVHLSGQSSRTLSDRPGLVCLSSRYVGYGRFGP